MGSEGQQDIEMSILTALLKGELTMQGVRRCGEAEKGMEGRGDLNNGERVKSSPLAASLLKGNPGQVGKTLERSFSDPSKRFCLQELMGNSIQDLHGPQNYH